MVNINLLHLFTFVLGSACTLKRQLLQTHFLRFIF
uniref:Uncharacterized protein n=1 Tax=Anguilla anguilla TaxID=7936 RepID=A0A0E9T652_ANGAN